jgi:hypothetical protein
MRVVVVSTDSLSFNMSIHLHAITPTTSFDGDGCIRKYPNWHTQRLIRVVNRPVVLVVRPVESTCERRRRKQLASAAMALLEFAAGSVDI